jgi:hypothetical protein
MCLLCYFIGMSYKGFGPSTKTLEGIDVEKIPSLQVFIYIYVCVYVHIYMYMYIYTHIYIHVYLYLHICICIYICIFIYIYIYVNKSPSHLTPTLPKGTACIFYYMYVYFLYFGWSPLFVRTIDFVAPLIVIYLIKPHHLRNSRYNPPSWYPNPDHL